jgi:hypothetical protein
MVAALELKGVPYQLFKPTANELKNVSAPTTLSHPWGHFSMKLTAERLTVLEWCAWALGEEELPLEETDLSELLSQIEKLIAEVRANPLPAFTQQLVLRHLKAIRSALMLYGVSGIEPVTAALNETMGAFSRSGGNVQPEFSAATEGQKGLLVRVASAIGSIGAKIDSMEKWGKRGTTAIKYGGALLRFLGWDLDIDPDSLNLPGKPPADDQ